MEMRHVGDLGEIGEEMERRRCAGNGRRREGEREALRSREAPPTRAGICLSMRIGAARAAG